MTHQPETRRLWQNMTLFDGRTVHPEPMTVAVCGERIERVCPSAAATGLDGEVMANGGVMTPGLIDCHTHLVFGGRRADEFEQRLEGASYEDIARAGGGILSTVSATRMASEDDLYAQARPRLEALMHDGVTTVEIKSGYGLTTRDEMKMLRVARRLGRDLPVRVQTTFLGAHALPPEFKGNADGYIDLVCSEMIPAVAAAELADAVDVFCEGIAFSVAQSERVFQAAQAHGLPVKAHAEQLSNLGGSALTARYKGLSADHIEWLDEPAIKAMAEAGTVATLLPGAFYTLRETRVPPIDLLRQYGVPMAVATDGNPGSSPIFQLTLMLHMACTLFRLTPQEVLQGVTVHAAQALGLQHETGRIKTGLAADFCIWDLEAPNELAYAVQPGRLTQRVFAGQETL
ncbi:MAG: imidazolonepropionase [Natronospirillum sp.]|uniref:imidazolonepropionase n=1 Tax=Natronospirillum sp. TaxID=2812955 RepID=UPI0025D76ACB|nr:imidazolonepropionase [Natronospirillum sp.]MCH8550755.1 imidazolonepropionase [Natronospirillum sp.]